MGIEAIVFYLFLIDAVFANIVAFFFSGWYKKNYKGFWKHFPTTKGWTIVYLILVLWVGWALKRLGVLAF